MPARAAWKGFLNVHQLSIPVRAFTAVRTDPEVTLHQLHRGCGKRIRQPRLCPEHGEVTSDDIVSGYEYQTDCHVIVERESLDALLPEDNKAIRVDCFVDRETIDAVYHSGRTYYTVPESPTAQRAFCVLRDGMRQTARHAVAQVVINRREHLVVLRPLSRLVAMTVLEYPQRVRPVEEYEGEVLSVTAQANELQLIGELIAAMTDPDFDLTKYRDRYTDDLSTLLQQLIGAAEPTPAAVPEEAAPSAIEELLRSSLAAALSRTPIAAPTSGLSDSRGIPSQPSRKTG